MAWLHQKKCCFVLWLVFIMSVMTQSVHGIHCYNCRNAHSNAECSLDEHLKDCDTVQTSRVTYDVCQTIIYSRGTPDEYITKKCAVGPCHLDTSQNKALNLDCTGNRCEECCATDGCNKAGATRQAEASIMLTLLAAIIHSSMQH